MTLESNPEPWNMASTKRFFGDPKPKVTNRKGAKPRFFEFKFGLSPKEGPTSRNRKNPSIHFWVDICGLVLRGLK